MTAAKRKPSHKQRSEALHSGVILRQQRGETIREEETVKAGVKRLRVVPPIETMLKRGAITPRQYDAACRLMDDYEMGVLGGREREELPPGIDAQGSVELMTARQLEAATRHRVAMQALGIRLSWVVVAVVHGGQSARAVAEAQGQDVKAVMGVLRTALEVVGDAYRLP